MEIVCALYFPLTAASCIIEERRFDLDRYVNCFVGNGKHFKNRIHIAETLRSEVPFSHQAPCAALYLRSV